MLRTLKVADKRQPENLDKSISNLLTMQIKIRERHILNSQNDIPNSSILQVLKKADMIRKNAVESILAERDILISVRNRFVVSLLYMTVLCLYLLYDHLLLILCLMS